MSMDQNKEFAPPVENKSVPDQPQRPPQKKQWLWTILFIALAVASVWAVVAQSKDFSPKQFWEYIQTASIPWLGMSLLGMLGFIVFEGMALVCICRAFGYRTKKRSGFVYSASDIYFSAITPSASGGQPASAYFMMKDGIPGMLVTVALLINLVMYTISILAIGAICLIFHFDVFLRFSTLSKLLIIVGIGTQVAMAFFFIMLLKNDKLLHRICRACLHFLCKIRILRKEEKKQARLDAYMENYRQYAHMLDGNASMKIKVFFFNFFQRAAQIAVTAFTYLAMGGDLSQAFSVWTMQGYVVLGSNTVPIPGAMGVSDYIMLDGFRSIMEESAAVNLELLSRSFSFYFCILICGVTTLISFRLIKRRTH